VANMVPRIYSGVPKVSRRLMSSRQVAMWTFAFFHLFVMLSFKIRHGYLLGLLPYPIQSFVSAYGYLTGSSSGFSFFAPRVPDEPMVEVTVHRRDSQYSFTLGAGNAERLRRVSTMLLQLEQANGFPEGAALFGSYMFSRDTAAIRVDVRFYRYAVPRLRTNGFAAPRQETAYVASFARSKDYVP
jgi:hypothetical protein